MNKKRILIISGVIFAILISTLFISYGFITSRISGNESSKKAVYNGKIIKVEYSDGTETLNSNQGVFTPGSTITKTFTIKNTGNVSVKYSINLDKVENTFVRKNDITYELYSNDVLLKNGIYDAKGIFPNNNLTILNKDVLNVGESKIYILKINYLNSEENQIIDSGKKISGVISIEESKVNINSLLVHGNMVQESDNLFDKNNMIQGYLPSSGAYPSTSADYPNSWYQIIDIKAGQTYKVTYTGNDVSYGRIRYIDNDTNEVVGSIGAWTNDYWKSTTSYNNGWKDGTITANKDFKLGILHLKNLPANFNLKVVNITPSIDNPIEIENLGDKTNNLFDPKMNFDGPYTINGITVDYLEDEDCYVLNGTAKATNRITERYINIPITKGNAFSLSAKYISGKIIRQNEKDYAMGYFGASDTPNSRTNFATIDFKEYDTVNENKTCNYNYISAFWFYIGAGVTFENYKVQIKLEEGLFATEYEPYGRYKIPINMHGKNLFDKNKTILGKNLNAETGTLYNSSVRGVSDFIKVDYNKTYTFVYDPKFTATRYINCYDANKVLIPGSECQARISGTFNTSATISFITDRVKYIRANFFWNESGTESEIDNFLIYEGSGDNSYEPYDGYVGNVFLNEPLRKVGDYSDYIDLIKGKVYRKIYTIPVLSSWTWSGYNSSGVTNNTFIYKGIGTHDMISNYGKAQSQMFKFSNSLYNRLEMYYAWLGVDGVDGIQPKILEMETSGNPFIIYYPTNEIPEESIEIKNILLNKKPSVIDICSNNNVCASDIEVEYDE